MKMKKPNGYGGIVGLGKNRRHDGQGRCQLELHQGNTWARQERRDKQGIHKKEHRRPPRSNRHDMNLYIMCILLSNFYSS